MKFEIDSSKGLFTVINQAGKREEMPLYSDQAFELLSRWWVKVGWDRKYHYTFSWLGRPVIQLPEDLMRMQEVFAKVRPTVIIETGVAHGGSLVFYASLFKALDIPGRVLGVEIELREANRSAIANHPLAPLIHIEIGSSVDPRLLDRVSEQILPSDVVMVVLDSNHSYAHVTEELEKYAKFVTAGSYIVATDGIMSDLHDVPRGVPGWKEDHPSRAASDFAKRHPEFTLEQPPWPFNESTLSRNVTHWPSAWLRRS